MLADFARRSRRRGRSNHSEHNNLDRSRRRPEPSRPEHASIAGLVGAGHCSGLVGAAAFVNRAQSGNITLDNRALWHAARRCSLDNRALCAPPGAAPSTTAPYGTPPGAAPSTTPPYGAAPSTNPSAGAGSPTTGTLYPPSTGVVSYRGVSLQGVRGMDTRSNQPSPSTSGASGGGSFDHRTPRPIDGATDNAGAAAGNTTVGGFPSRPSGNGSDRPVVEIGDLPK